MPLLFKHNVPLMGVWKIDESAEELEEMYAGASLRGTKQSLPVTVGRDAPPRRRQEYYATRLLLDELLPARANITYNEHGAPRLENSPFNISISHTKGYAAVILSSSSQPGIDIEYHSDRAWRLRERFLCDSELSFAQCGLKCGLKTPIHRGKLRTPDYERTTLATLFWCAKETAFKALGMQNVDFIEHLHINGGSSRGEIASLGERLSLTTQSLSLTESRTEANRQIIINYSITEDYILTWTE